MTSGLDAVRFLVSDLSPFSWSAEFYRAIGGQQIGTTLQTICDG